ncbi:MAG: VWA domain-containing protein [Vicinamibacterales bacterium]
MHSNVHPASLAAILAVLAVSAVPAQEQDAFRFRSGVELVNVTATVTDDDGRFVSGLRKEDFRVYDDSDLVEVTHFSNERVPVSLGILLDTSGSMTPDKMSSARGAIERFIGLLGPDDEMFLARFANVPELAQGWTKDRRLLSRALDRLYAGGGTAMYDGIADALPIAQSGKNRKKAIVLISDGNDTSSTTTPRDVKAMIRQSEVLVYAIGVDGRLQTTVRGGGYPRIPPPLPFPIPGRGGRGFPVPPPIGGRGGGTLGRGNLGDGLDANALRQVTDDTGGRTEIVRDFSDLPGATARIADELSKQYYLGYVSPGRKDGRWHAIRVEVPDRRLNVRARRGYVAS